MSKLKILESMIRRIIKEESELPRVKSLLGNDFMFGSKNFQTDELFPGSDRPTSNQYGKVYKMTPLNVEYIPGESRNEPGSRSKVDRIEQSFKKLYQKFQNEFGVDNVKVLWYNPWANTSRVRSQGPSPAPNIDILVGPGVNSQKIKGKKTIPSGSRGRQFN